MVRAIILGDTHGNSLAFKDAVKVAVEYGADRIIQVGDFGVWGTDDGSEFISDIQEELEGSNVHLYALPGNHEDHLLWNEITHNWKGVLTDNITLLPRTHTWIWDGKRFAVAGGAFSIDRAYRVKGASWFEEETLTPEEVYNYPDDKVDYLFTHDASSRSPFPFNILEIPQSHDHRLLIDTVLSRSMPNKHFHGHYHMRMDWMNRLSGDHWAETFGLECDGMNFNMVLLDTETDAVSWVDKGWS